jgi:hypothetical protein
MAFAGGFEWHCGRCGVYITDDPCGAVAGMSGWPYQRWKKNQRYWSDHADQERKSKTSGRVARCGFADMAVQDDACFPLRLGKRDRNVVR